MNRETDDIEASIQREMKALVEAYLMGRSLDQIYRHAQEFLCNNPQVKGTISRAYLQRILEGRAITNPSVAKLIILHHVLQIPYSAMLSIYSCLKVQEDESIPPHRIEIAREKLFQATAALAEAHDALDKEAEN